MTALLQSVNYHFFIIQNNFATAGLNGMITMVQYKTGFSIGYASLLLNIPLCVVNKHQLFDFKKIIEKYDDTFSFYEVVNETYGRFKTIKH